MCTFLVEDVVSPLVVLLVGDAGLLEEVEVDEPAGQLAHVVEVDADELAEAGGVVVPDGLGVTVGLQDRVRLHDPVLQVGLTEKFAQSLEAHTGFG